MEILYTTLNLDLKLSKLHGHYELSNEFVYLHDKFVATKDPTKYFTLGPNINVPRKDQLLLNLQYNTLYYGFNIYSYVEYCCQAQEFFTYFLNYEILTERCSAEFPTNVKTIFSILNKYTQSK